MTSWLATEVAGDPADCRLAADGLRHLAEALTVCAHLAGRHAALPAAELDGLAGRAFRHHAARLRDECRAARHHAELLGAGLDELADQLAGCGLAMEAARSQARSRLVVTPTTIQPPVLEGVDPSAQDAWQAAVAAVGVVRRREAAAQAVWRALLARPAPEPPARGSDPAALPSSPPTALPIGGPGWPGAAATSHQGPHPVPHPSPETALVVEPMPSGPQVAMVTEPVGHGIHATPLLPDPWPHPWPGGLPEIDEIVATEAMAGPWPQAPEWADA